MTDTALVTAEERAPAPVHTTVEGMILAAIERGVPVETMEKLLAMSERMKAEQARTEYFEALSAFQDECPVIPKTKRVGGGNYSYMYAPLEVIVQTVQPILRRHGLSYRFDTAFEAQPPAQVVYCTVYHTAGHAETSNFRTPIDPSGRMNDMQKSASAQTYAKRYAFCNALGILTGDEDDDGRSGGEKAHTPAPEWQPRAGGGRPAPEPPNPVTAGHAIVNPNVPGSPIARGKTMTSVRDVLMQRGYTEQDLKTPDEPQNHESDPEAEIRADARRKCLELAFEYLRGKAGTDGGASQPSSMLQAEVWLNAASRKHFKRKLEELNSGELVQLHEKLEKFTAEKTG